MSKVFNRMRPMREKDELWSEGLVVICTIDPNKTDDEICREIYSKLNTLRRRMVYRFRKQKYIGEMVTPQNRVTINRRALDDYEQKFLDSFLAGNSLKEIAIIIGKPYPTVWKIWNRVVIKLRRDN